MRDAHYEHSRKNNLCEISTNSDLASLNEKYRAYATIDHDRDASYFVSGAREGTRSKVCRFPNSSRHKMDDYCRRDKVEVSSVNVIRSGFRGLHRTSRASFY